MGSGQGADSFSPNTNSPRNGDGQRQQGAEIQNLNLMGQPVKTLKYFTLAVTSYFREWSLYAFSKVRTILPWISVLVPVVSLLVAVDGPHTKHLQEVSNYLMFGLWWLALGVASSIGLGYGFHTFVLYLGPHIAFFTFKAMQCGRADLKSALYDTIQLNRVPSWLDKSCHEFGEPLFPLSHGLRVPLTSILPQVQVEAIIWGVGTALGELPPYFISRTARLSGNVDDTISSDDTSRFASFKRFLLSHSRYLNFWTVLLLASVPNPLFDVAGIMCGQFGIPFWEFFCATLIGKAIIKTHIQTILVISLCNNQLLNWLENELIWIFSFIPGLDSVVPRLLIKLHGLREDYMSPDPSNVEGKNWNMSTIWNSVVWMMLIVVIMQLVNSTAQQFYLKLKQEELISGVHNESSPTQSD